MTRSIDEIRADIDVTDQEIARHLARRSRLADEAAATRPERIRVPEREEDVVVSWVALHKWHGGTYPDEVVGAMVLALLERDPILVGEAPSRESDRAFGGRSGRRLADVAGVSHERILSCPRWNLLPSNPGRVEGRKGDRFPLARAREHAESISRFLAFRRVIFVGRRVARAFRVPETVDVLTWTAGPPGSTFAIVPHPSGVNTWWNDPAHRDAARAFLRDALRESR